MTVAFASAGVPIFVFTNPGVRKWLKDNVQGGQDMPSEWSLRKFLTEMGDIDIQKSMSILKEKDVFVMVDETQDFRNRKILNILMAPAESDRKFRLVASDFLLKCNAEVVVQKILLAIQKVNVTIDRVIALISDNAKYMMLAGRLLMGLNSRFIHSTCWAHILHLVSDEIRLSMKETDRFIAQVKSSLVKAASRRQELIDVLEMNQLDARLPPTPVLTRWTTWLETGSYHFRNFVALKQWIQNTDPDSAAVRELKELIQNEHVYQNLRKIHTVFPGLSQAIKVLQGMSLPASDVYTMVANVRELIGNQLGVGSAKLEKYWTGQNEHPAIEFWRSAQLLDPRKFILNPVRELPACLRKFSTVPVPDLEFAHYRSLCSQIGEGTEITATKFWNLNKRELPVLSQLALAALSVPATSAEVERSFSTAKRLMRPERNRLTEENFGLHLRLIFNKSEKDLVDEASSSEDDEDD